MRRAFPILSFALLLGCAHATLAQIRIGTVKGVVRDANRALIADAEVSLENRITGFRRTVHTTPGGEFTFNEVPFNSYVLAASASGFERATVNVQVDSNLPAVINVSLNIATATASVVIQTDNPLVSANSSGTETTVDESFIERIPASMRTLQDVVATTSGWRTENDGLLHIRGVDDGALYVIDGVPVTDRVDSLFGGAYDTDQIQSLNVITGNIPAEFGGRSGAVIILQSQSMIGRQLNGTFAANGGSFDTLQLDAAAGGELHRNAAFYVAGNGRRSQRFLDPVDPGNFNNRGGTGNFNARFDWQPAARDLLMFSVVAAGTDLHIPNDVAQELAGQRQRLELRNNSESVRWQRTWSAKTVTDVAYFRQSYAAKLFGSAFDTPLVAGQNRHDTRQGVIASLTHATGKHTIKAGIEATRVSLSEFFTFAVTDVDAAIEHNISANALAFDRSNPFVFAGDKTRATFSAYVQDAFEIRKNLTLNAGVRYDESSLLVQDHQFSPRVGIAYYLPQSKTTLRASFNRLYMPPQIENLLLASSEQARQLSPFATPAGGGSALVAPETSSAYEIGFAQEVFKVLKLDAAYWYRSFHNYDDPNVFFNTPIVFPNSVANGFARGVDVRLDVPERDHWSGYVSYGNARVLQTGPINGGLFLTDDFLKIGPGVRFIPDQDERNSVSFAVNYNFDRQRAWLSFSGRYESGVPLEVDTEALPQLATMPGADLVNFDRQRVKPWTIMNISSGWEALRRDRMSVKLEFSVENFANRRFVYNFGNPFSGTHFGAPRSWRGGLRLTFH
jgi:outer membrane receptor for ferrienterochelin and colicin